MISAGCKTQIIIWKKVFSSMHPALDLLLKQFFNAILLLWTWDVVPHYNSHRAVQCVPYSPPSIQKEAERYLRNWCWKLPIVTQWFVWTHPPANRSSIKSWLYRNAIKPVEQDFTWIRLLLQSCICHMLISPRGRKPEYYARFFKQNNKWVGVWALKGCEALKLV